MILFSFGGVDYTRFIQLPTYNISGKPIYSSWTDGNGVEHRDISRSRISGSFTLWIDDVSQYLSFLAAIRTARTPGGYIPCRLYDNERDTVFDADCYVDLKFSNELPLLGRGKHGGIAVTITER